MTTTAQPQMFRLELLEDGHRSIIRARPVDPADTTPDTVQKPAPRSPRKPTAKSRSGSSLITVREPADIFRCHPQTIYAMLDRGELAEVHIGHKRLIDTDDLPESHRAEARKPTPAKRRAMTGHLAEIVRDMEEQR